MAQRFVTCCLIAVGLLTKQHIMVGAGGSVGWSSWPRDREEEEGIGSSSPFRALHWARPPKVPLRGSTTLETKAFMDMQDLINLFNPGMSDTLLLFVICGLVLSV